MAANKRKAASTRSQAAKGAKGQDQTSSPDQTKGTGAQSDRAPATQPSASEPTKASDTPAPAEPKAAEPSTQASGDQGKDKPQDTGAATQDTTAAESEARKAEQPSPGSQGSKPGEDPPSGEIDAVWVTSVPKSFRRAGFRFDRNGVGIALEALSEDQLDALESEPNLKVERCTFPIEES